MAREGTPSSIYTLYARFCSAPQTESAQIAKVAAQVHVVMIINREPSVCTNVTEIITIEIMYAGREPGVYIIQVVSSTYLYARGT